MQTHVRNPFITVRTLGAVLPADILQRIAEGDSSLKGLRPADYHLAEGEKINEIINRSWTRLLGAWAGFQAALGKLPKTDLATSITREKWLLVLFNELGYGRLQVSKALELEGRTFPISHMWQNFPIHLVGARVELDKKLPGVAGAARSSPHSMVQEFLNRSHEHIWAFLSNGLIFRILRDNVSLTRQAYLEFNLQAMMEGEVYPDFVLLWLLCHQSRVESPKPEECWLEKWSNAAREQGTRALDQLRNGVEQAINILGSGFITHPANGELREALRTGKLDKQDYYRQTLRIIYRLLFLFVAEDRELLYDPAADRKTKELYIRYYSTARLRRMAQRHRGTKHSDLWYGVQLVFDKLDEGCPELGLPALGSTLWERDWIRDVAYCRLSNKYLLDAIRELAYTVEQNTLRPVDFRNLGSEELGSVYESLLELHPDLNLEAGSFELKTAGGHERKSTGSYYTPESLIQCLLGSALEPVMNEAMKQNDPEKTLLDLKICDPAAGSGHFLIGASHRMAKRLAAIRTGEDEPSPDAVKTALRDVISRCIYGVDINPMAVELCKVSLWMEAMEPGKPLNFLDHHIKCGNSLIGASPELLEKGIPDDAFKPVTGDDKKLASEVRQKNKQERKGQKDLFASEHLSPEIEKTFERLKAILNLPENSKEQVERKKKLYHDALNERILTHQKQIANLWVSAFFWPLTKEKSALAPTQEILDNFREGPTRIRGDIIGYSERLAGSYRFFHWNLEFPEVFEREASGFDCVLGNPPWERIKLQEKEFFAAREPNIFNVPDAATRKSMIEELRKTNKDLWDEFELGKRESENESNFLRKSNKYPLSAVGDINTYQIFAELDKSLTQPTGTIGIIVPTGIATDETLKLFFADLVENHQLDSLFGFENENNLFPALMHNFKFALLTFCGKEKNIENPLFAFGLWSPDELKDDNRIFSLSEEDFYLMNPNTRNCPLFRNKYEADLIKSIYRRVPIFWNENNKEEGNPWNSRFFTMFHMTNDSHLFRTKQQLQEKSFLLCGNTFKKNNEQYFPLYEGKMINYYDHRYANAIASKTNGQRGSSEITSTRMHKDINFRVMPRFFVHSEYVNRFVKNKKWLLGYRGITGAVVNNRTTIFSLLPPVGMGNTIILIDNDKYKATEFCCLIANFNSIVLDFVVRQKLGGTALNYFIVKQLPIFPPKYYSQSFQNSSLQDFIKERVVRLVYTNYEMKDFAVECGFDGKPFNWDDEERAAIIGELDALYFKLYDLREKDINIVLEHFKSLKKTEIEKYGEYRTKRVILEIYDEMAEAIRTGKPYQSRLEPPPADPRCAHPAREHRDE